MATTQLERLRSSRSLLLKASTRSRFQRAARDGLKKALRIRPNALFAHACCITEMTYSESSRSPEHRATPQRRSSPWKQPHRWRRAGRACTVALSWSLSPLHFGWCGSGTPFAFEFAVATQWRPCGGGGVEGASHVGAAARAASSEEAPSKFERRRSNFVNRGCASLPGLCGGTARWRRGRERYESPTTPRKPRPCLVPPPPATTYARGRGRELGLLQQVTALEQAGMTYTRAVTGTLTVESVQF